MSERERASLHSREFLGGWKEADWGGLLPETSEGAAALLEDRVEQRGLKACLTTCPTCEHRRALRQSRRKRRHWGRADKMDPCRHKDTAVLAPGPEDPGLILSIYSVAHNHLQVEFLGDLTSSSGLCGHHACMMYTDLHTHTHTQNTHNHKVIYILLKKWCNPLQNPLKADHRDFKSCCCSLLRLENEVCSFVCLCGGIVFMHIL